MEGKGGREQTIAVSSARVDTLRECLRANAGTHWSFPKMCSKVAGGSGRAGGRREGERRGKEEEGGWLMRIESWGRFSVYVARIRNFGAPEPTSNIPPFSPPPVSKRTYTSARMCSHT